MSNVPATSSFGQTALRLMCVAFALAAVMPFTTKSALGQSKRIFAEPVFIDTDIGDDIDDAYALALALSSPKLHVVGVAGAWGDTALRARMLTRFLKTAGKAAIPVGAGLPTSGRANFTQGAWAAGGAASPSTYPDGVELLRQSILRYPGKLTLIALGPETDLAELLRRDPVTFRKLKRIVIMGGSVHVGYKPGSAPAPEYNIVCDAPAAAAVFAAGVPLTVMPLDSTVVTLSPAERSRMFYGKSPLAATLQELTNEWSAHSKYTFTLYDVVPVASILDPAVCPTEPMSLRVDNEGYTRISDGKPNTQVCTKLDEQRFRQLLLGSLSPAKP